MSLEKHCKVHRICCSVVPLRVATDARLVTLGVQVCPALAITIEAEEREDGSRKTTRCCPACAMIQGVGFAAAGCLCEGSPPCVSACALCVLLLPPASMSIDRAHILCIYRFWLHMHSRHKPDRHMHSTNSTVVQQSFVKSWMCNSALACFVL